jgi:Phosphopantetheine attachment site
LPSNASIDEEQGFFEMGMDSLMSMVLRNELQLRLDSQMVHTKPTNTPKVFGSYYLKDHHDGIPVITLMMPIYKGKFSADMEVS